MTKPRVVLVYANPSITATPVPPYGMERIARCFSLAGCDVVMLAPFIEEDPVAFLKKALEPVPALIGLSIRNIDDALVVRGEVGPGELDIAFYLDAILPIVLASVAAVGRDRVLAGGAALSSGCSPILRHLGLRWGVRGPADDIAWKLGRGLAGGEGLVFPDDPRVVDIDQDGDWAPHQSPPVAAGLGAPWRVPPGPTPRMGPYLGLTLARGGRVPVEISMGCDRRCNFCVEARFASQVVIARPVAEIVDEISALESVGVRQFWLGCSELNVPNASHAIAVLTALAGRDLDLQVFLQPAPVNDALLDALEGVGIDPTSLSFEFGHLDDGILRAGGGPANLRHIEQLVELWQRRGYRQLGGSILLGSHPLETEATINSALEFALAIDGVFPDGFGLAYACGGRVYPETKLADHIAENWVACRPHLYTLGGEEPDPAFVRPVVHCRPMSPRLLMTRVRTTLVHARGNMGPMNTEAPAGLDRLSAERDVNLGIWRIQEDQFHDAETAFVAALGHQPGHLEALAQLSMLRANRLNDSVGARWALNRLATLLPLTDPRQEEIARALRQLS